MRSTAGDSRIIIAFTACGGADRSVERPPSTTTVISGLDQSEIDDAALGILLADSEVTDALGGSDLRGVETGGMFWDGTEPVGSVLILTVDGPHPRRPAPTEFVRMIPTQGSARVRKNEGWVDAERAAPGGGSSVGTTRSL